MLESLKPQPGPHAQCMSLLCGWSGAWIDSNQECPRCHKPALRRFPSEAAGWRAWRKLRSVLSI